VAGPPTPEGDEGEGEGERRGEEGGKKSPYPYPLWYLKMAGLPEEKNRTRREEKEKRGKRGKKKDEEPNLEPLPPGEAAPSPTLFFQKEG